MKKNLPLLHLLVASFLLPAASVAQQPDRFAYAITDVQQSGASWSFLRKLNLQTGEYSQVLLQGNDIHAAAFHAADKKIINSPHTDARVGQWTQAPFGTGVAAAAYDRRSNRLYYTPMFVDQLRYVDLKSMKVFFADEQAFTGKATKSADQGNIVTRMVIAADGFGYALTNDATQLIRFSTGKQIQITDLGSLVDDPSNKSNSVHNSCSSYGGDMVADDDGNLYLFSARNQVYKINIASRVATHLGTMKGLPAGFTVNGAAVTDNNRIILASATQSLPCYTLDIRSLEAIAFPINGTIWQSSDLANSNLLISGNKKQATVMETIGATKTNGAATQIHIFPNPVTENQFIIRFDGLDAGNYSIQITDVMGRRVIERAVVLSFDGQVEKIKLSPSDAKGVYLIKVLDAKNNTAFSSKLVVQ